MRRHTGTLSRSGRPTDERSFRAAHAELLAEGFSFDFMHDGETFAEHVAPLEAQRRGRDVGAVVESTGSWPR